jgi:hypothetical protein
MARGSFSDQAAQEALESADQGAAEIANALTQPLSFVVKMAG